LNKEKKWTPKPPTVDTSSESLSCFGTQSIPFGALTLVRTPSLQNRSHNILTVWHLPSSQSQLPWINQSWNPWNFWLFSSISPYTKHLRLSIFGRELMRSGYTQSSLPTHFYNVRAFFPHKNYWQTCYSKTTHHPHKQVEKHSKTHF